jgi:ribosomal protein L40E
MAKQAEQKEVSKGICRFCQGEFAKNKMTQHLKSCKARFAREDKQDGQKQRLFHLFVEGTYRPSYWMHLEVPAAATLADLDDFLRETWLECCGHLSEFEIGDVSYSSDTEGGWEMELDEGLTLVTNDGNEEDEEEEEEELPSMEEMAEDIARQLSAEFHADLKDVPVQQIEEKLARLFAENMPPGMSAATMPALRPLLSYMARSLQQGTLAEDLEDAEMEDEEGGMDVELGDVLNVGEKFSYVYDFGSSTNLSFRVLAEREGVLPADEEEEEEEIEEDEDGAEIGVVVMARNEPPALKCQKCGKPATRVLPEYEYNYLEEAGLCDVHAKAYGDLEELLPVVNSPRVGVCGYTGEYDEEEEWDEEEEEDEDE